MAQKIEHGYQTLAQLSDVYLEDSFVLAISEQDANIDFVLEVALKEQHPMPAAPAANEQHCYRRGLLRFPNVHRAHWSARTVVPARDANGEVDYGNIDAFVQEDRSYRLSGDWGAVDIRSDPPELTLT